MAKCPAARRDRQIVRILGLAEGGRLSVYELAVRSKVRRETIYVREREWHPTQRICMRRDGRVELTFRAGGAFEIARWILGWGDAAEVVRPAALRRDIASMLGCAAATYRQRAHTPNHRGRAR
jgi:predicted DNA-binding transcriptional regulator YafY